MKKTRILATHITEDMMDLTPKSLLVKEWRLWSQCFGKLLVINGTSSSGKSTYCSSCLSSGYEVICLDVMYEDLFNEQLRLNQSTACLIEIAEQFLTPNELESVSLRFSKIPNRNFTEEQLRIIKSLRYESKAVAKHITDQDISNVTYLRSKSSLFSGKSVVLDLVCPSDEELGQLEASFQYYPMEVVLFYTPLAQNIDRCLKRMQKAVIDWQIIEVRSLVYNVLDQRDVFYSFKPTTQTGEETVLELVDHEGQQKVFEVVKTLWQSCIDIEYLILIDHHKWSKDEVHQDANSVVQKFETSLSGIQQVHEQCAVVSNIRYDRIITDACSSIELTQYKEDVPALLGSLQEMELV